MSTILTLSNLHGHFESARDKLAEDRKSLLSAFPLPVDFSRDEYSFAYRRAERLGLDVITQTLKDVAWLPMQLDPKSEILLDSRQSLKRWMVSAAKIQPDGSHFGNDFIHTLTRAAMINGWDSDLLRVTALKIGGLFHDLSCLIGLIYYGTWMAENGIDGLPVSDPFDLEKTASEISRLTRSPEVAALLRKRKQVDHQKKDQLPPRAKPVLTVIHNDHWTDNPAGI